jgi:hypothetical protein
MRDPIHVFPVALELEPVDHRGRVRFGISVRGIVRISLAMRPEALAHHDVLQAIAVNVRQRQRMKLREMNAIAILLRRLAHDQVLAK